MRCSLCGFEFDENQAQACCQGCVGQNGCDLVKCPNCNFEIVREPEWIKKFFRKNGNQSAGRQSALAVPLHELETNRKAQISHIRMQDHSLLQKIIAIGALPKTELVLIQKFPSYVLRMGQSQFVIDKELASCIYAKSI